MPDRKTLPSGQDTTRLVLNFLFVTCALINNNKLTSAFHPSTLEIMDFIHRQRKRRFFMVKEFRSI
jgi:hypothetical protein